MDFTFVSPHLFDSIGIAGFCLYVLTYTLLSLRLLSGNCVLYFSMNLAAACCVLIGLSVNFNLASALIQGFWITISLVAIAIRVLAPARVSRRPVPATARATGAARS